ncbi:MAG: YncE family protein, partial [candidate division WOR-3 bacterium]
MSKATLLLLFLALSCKAKAQDASLPQASEPVPDETPKPNPFSWVLDTIYEIARIPSGSLPKAVKITPDGRFALTTNFGDGTIGKIAIGEKKWIYMQKNFDPRRKDLSLPVEVAFDSLRPWAYISDFSHARVRVFDWQADTFIRDIKVGSLPKILEVSPDGKMLWVSNWGSNSVSVVDLDSLKEIKRIPVGSLAPRGIALTTDGRAYVCDFDGSAISIINANSLELVRVIKAPRLPRHAVARGDTAFITLYGTGKLWVMTGDSLLKEYTIGGHPKTLVLFGRYAFIANYGADRMDVFDLAEAKVIARVPAGKSPSGIDITPDGQYIYLTNWFDPSLSIYKVE